MDADFNWLTTTKKNATEAADAVALAKKTAESDARSASDAKNFIEGLKAKAEVALSSMETARDDVATLAKRVSDDAASVTQSRANSDASYSAIAAVQQQVSDAASKVQTDASSVAARAAETQNLLASMTEVTETAKASHDSVIAHEEKLTDLSSRFAELHAKIESLLPGATSAGLASAFRDQKARFNRPQALWGTTFGLAIVALLVVGTIGWPAIAKEPETWQTILRHFVSRLPIALPLVWLALYAGRNYMLALRLQEDYAYKEAISSAFEGYRREMSGIIATGDHALPILTLSDNVLRTLAQRPGRLYDGKHEDLTPLTPVSKLLKDTRLLHVLGLDKADSTEKEP